MQRLLSVDKGVYVVKGLKDGMISYSAGSRYFLTSKAMYEDAGEFIGSIIRGYCPDLAEYIKNLLDEANVDYDILPMLSEYWFDDSAKLQRWENILHGVFQ
jgi:hypothetical protein